MKMTSAQTTVDVFQAIADPNRRRLFDLLSSRARSVQELAGHFEISLAAVSQHLKVLLAAGLVSREVRGRFRIYRAEPGALRAAHDWTAQYSAFWSENLDRLNAYWAATEEPDGGAAP